MKKKAIILMAAFTMFSAACKNDLTSLNVDPKHPSTVPSYTLFTNAEHSLANTISSSNVNLNIFRLIEQQWEETTYTDEANYNIQSRKIPDGIWDEFYTVILVNLEQAKKVIPTDVSDKVQQQNEIAIADMLEVYSFYYLVTTFGDIPFSQALNIATPFPKFDDAATVYKNLLARLDIDIAALQAGKSSVSYGSADVIYGGDVGKWTLFGNTFKLKMGMTLINSSNATLNSLGKITVETAANVSSPGFFGSNADNAMFQYLSSSPNTNPIWVDLVQSGRQDFVACSTLMGYLNPDGETAADPRLPYYFTVNSDGNYSGGAPGALANFGSNSKPAGPLLVAGSVGSVTNPDFPGDLLDYAETEFNLAEAAAKGFAVTGSAATHYVNAVTASINFWTGGASATSYLNANPIGTTKQAMLNSISFQKYLALYNRGWDAWIETRRTNYPILVAPETATSAFPLRFTYPINEQEVNVVNYNTASNAIGGDLVTTAIVFFK